MKDQWLLQTRCPVAHSDEAHGGSLWMTFGSILGCNVKFQCGGFSYWWYFLMVLFSVAYTVKGLKG